METRLETHCEFLYQLALESSKDSFIRKIQNASEEELRAVVELLFNQDLFDCACGQFIEQDLVRDPRNTIIRNWQLVRSVVQKVFLEILSLEFTLLILAAGQNEYTV